MAVLVLALCWFKLGSLDTGYHIAYGRHFLDTGRIVDRDPFLYPETAVPFVNANWGSQIIMALVERAAGPNGLIALRIALVAIIFACIALVLCRQAVPCGQVASRDPQIEPVKPPTNQPLASSIFSRQPSIGLWLAWTWLLAALAAYERFSMRPELFSYAVMSIMLVPLVRGLRSWRGVLAIALLQLLWVNLHSYFLVGIFLTAACLAGELISWLWRRRQSARADGSGQSARKKPAARLLAIALAVQAGVCLINPWHYRGAAFPLATLQFLRGEDVMGGAAGDASRSAWSEISEFQSPFSFHGQIINARTIHAYYVLLGVVAVGLIALLARGQVGPALVVLLLFAMSTQMRRNVAQFAFAAAPLSVGAIAAAVPWSALHRTLRRFFKPVLIAATVGLACWWIYGIADGRFYYVERRLTRELGTGYSDRTFQRAAAEWLAAHPNLKPRLFVDYFSSSNTLPWLPARFKLFVDTNTFAYEDQTLQAAFKLGLGETDHNRFFEQYNVNVVLMHCGPDTQMLVRRMADDDEWALVYFDRHSVIFVRRIPQHLGVIPVHRLSGQDLNTDEWISGLSGPRCYKALALGTWVNVPMSLGWSEPAVVLLEAALDLAPDYHEAWHYLGVCHGNLGNAAARAKQYDEAERHWTRSLECFREALDLTPDHADALRYLEATKQRLRLLEGIRANEP
ncbi:MAG: tetratricopeptide repeat protein [Phycisphaerae bacterium]|nr:tetratricopeptide repeat protein [Phycisphaerae bacterium]